jgi:cell division protein FtsI/penicillin-binding protein 2
MEVNDNKSRTVVVIVLIVFFSLIAGTIYLFLRSNSKTNNNSKTTLEEQESLHVTEKEENPAGAMVDVEEKVLVGKTVDNVESVRSYRGTVDSIDGGKISLNTEEGIVGVELSEDVYLSCTDRNLEDVEYLNLDLIKIQITEKANKLQGKVPIGEYVIIGNIWTGEKTYINNIILDYPDCVQNIR